MCWQEKRPTNEHCLALTLDKILKCQISLDFNALENAENSNKQALKRTYILSSQQHEEYPE
jgi:hypothetical protein